MFKYPVFLPGESHGQRRLVDSQAQRVGHKESDMAKCLNNRAACQALVTEDSEGTDYFLPVQRTRLIPLLWDTHVPKCTHTVGHQADLTQHLLN